MGTIRGIYSYTFLRRLCQCDLCQPVKPVEPTFQAVAVIVTTTVVKDWGGSDEHPSTDRCGVLDVDWPALSVLFQHAVDRSTKQLVGSGDFRIQQLTPMALLKPGGDPTYTTSSSHFFGMQDGRLIPQAPGAGGVPAGGKQGWRQAMRCSRVCRSWDLPGFLRGRARYR